LFEISSSVKKCFYKSFLERLDTLIVVGSHILSDYKNREINLPKEVIIEPAFLPPPLDEEQKILNTYPKELTDFIDNCSPFITANAFQITFHEDIDLYGLDMCIELTAKLKNDYPNIGFVFALANEKANVEYLEKMKIRIQELEIEDNFYFITGQKELWPLFKQANLMIRLTNTDGDAISIREAILFDTKTIASDVSNRPDETVLFKSRDLNDLYKKAKGIIDEKSEV
jgi:hypothetical protein